MAFFDRIKNVWSVFRKEDIRDAPDYHPFYNGTFASRPDRRTFYGNNLQKVVGSVYNRIAVDCSQMNPYHIRKDENGQYLETIDSRLNYALSKSANIDQTGRELIREAVMTMLNTGNVCIVPTYTTADPRKTKSYDIYEMRVGTIKGWGPQKVRVEVYNDATGQMVEKEVDKSYVVIVENPFYDIMNKSNSTGQRLTRVLNQLDRVNEQGSSGKLDLIIQLPYVIKSDARRQQAEQRRKDIEAQLTGSQYGIAYTDGTERIVQLNRSLENNLWNQARELEDQFYNQLGLAKAIFDGTANEPVMINYKNQTIEPIVLALSEEMERKWISQTAQTQGQAIRFFDDPFRLVPVAELAEMVDKFTRNEIMTSNEIRGLLHLKPVADPKADELRNSNLNQPESSGSDTKETVNIQNQEIEEEG